MSMADDHRAFWYAVDSQSPFPQRGEWLDARNESCVAVMSSGERCYRTSEYGWCDFHFGRVIEAVALAHEEQVLAKVRRLNPTAFRYWIGIEMLRDAERVLEEADAQVYFIACGGYVKIGYSKNPAARLGALRQGRRAASRTLAPDDIDLADAVIVGCVPGNMNVERRIHSLLSEYRAVGEWFQLSPTVISAIDCIVFGAEPPRAIEKGLRDMEDGRPRWEKRSAS